MDMQNFNQMLLASIGVGLAVVDEKSNEILFANPLFTTWFPALHSEQAKLSRVLEIVGLEDLVEKDGCYQGN